MGSGLLDRLFESKEEKLIKKMLENNRTIYDLLGKRLDSLQEMILELTKIGAEHKEVITFLLTHINFDKDSQKDLIKLLKGLDSLNKKVKEK